MTNRKRWLTIGVLAVIILVTLGLIASWKNTKTEFAIHDKINEGINVGMNDLYQTAPRVVFTDKNNSYYVVDTYNLKHSTFTVYKDVLESVNFDMATPMCKITRVNLSGYGNMEVIVTFQFRGLFGVAHTVNYSQAVNSPHFKKPTGDAHY